MSEYQKEWYQRNKQRIQLKIKLDRELNPEKYAELNRKRSEKRKLLKQKVSKSYRSHHPAYDLWRGAQDRARKYNVPFCITVDDILIPEVCPVFGTPFEKGTRLCASLDRIIPELGYTKENIQVISNLANAMKQNATEEQLECFAKWILNKKQLIL